MKKRLQFVKRVCSCIVKVVFPILSLFLVCQYIYISCPLTTAVWKKRFLVIIINIFKTSSMLFVTVDCKISPIYIYIIANISKVSIHKSKGAKSLNASLEKRFRFLYKIFCITVICRVLNLNLV